jgi:gliding motility associated protien GldN
MKVKFLLVTATTLLIGSFCLETSAQGGIQTVLDGAYVKEHNATKRVIPYPHLREADVMWAHRVWQVIDLRQKMNHHLYFPIDLIEDRKSLFDVVRHALLTEGSMTAYSLGPTGTDDEFRYPMTQAELDSILNPIVLRYQEDLDTGERIPVENEEPIQGQDIIKYKIKEDWVFDKQRSERYVRIIGLAPVREVFDEDGESKGDETLFWLYFPECRYVFANWDVFNLQNDAQRRTYEDIFQKRMFASYMIKESNVYDRSINEYADGIQELLESDRIKGELFEIEHDLWHY